MKKERTPLTKKKYITIVITAIVLFFLAFGVLAAAAILQENGVSNDICYTLMASAGVILVSDLVFMFVYFGRMMEYEIEVKSKKLEEVKYETVKGITKTKIKESCLREGFKNKDDLYYYKRSVILAKDVINYFVKGVECDDIKSAVVKELEAFDARQYKNANKCLLLFLFKDGITEDEISYVSDISKNLILTETSMNMPRYDTAVTVLVDTQKNTGYYVPCKSRLAVYTYGVKMLIKLVS